MKCFMTIAALAASPLLSLAATVYVPDEYPTIQDAIDGSNAGDTIVVRAGTYFENIDYLGKSISLQSENGAEETIIDGRMLGSVVTFQSGESTGAVLRGFTIRNGTGKLRPGWGDFYGAGIYCGNHSSPLIVDNIITDNSASGGIGRGAGGGMFVVMSSPTITGNLITENSAFEGCGIACRYSEAVIVGNVITKNSGFYGGGISCIGDVCVIRDNVIRNNVVSYGGGGVESLGSYPGSLIASNVIENNEGGDGGGGILCDCQSKVLIVNNRICGNRASLVNGGVGGGIACIIRSAPIVLNNDIIGNTAALGGGGVCCQQESSATIINTILWDNASPIGSEIWVRTPSSWGPSSLEIHYSDVDGGQASTEVDTGCTLVWGNGMLEADPLFVDQGAGDYHLSFGSPCVDAGFNHSRLPDVDFEGDPRIVGGRADIGADEFYFHLYRAGDVIPGSSMDLRIVGGPGMPVLLGHSIATQDPPQQTAWGDLFLTLPPGWSSKIGTIPANGVLSFPITVPSFWNPGDEKYFQALVGAPGGTYATLTNLETLEVE